MIKLKTSMWNTSPVLLGEHFSIFSRDGFERYSFHGQDVVYEKIHLVFGTTNPSMDGSMNPKAVFQMANYNRRQIKSRPIHEAGVLRPCLSK